MPFSSQARRLLLANRPLAVRGASVLLALTPFSLQERALLPLFRQALAVPLNDGELNFLDARVLRIQVDDLRWRLSLSLADGRLVMAPPDNEYAVCIRADSADFLALINRVDDPDTLFFQRRLAIEGDTELGLAVKNLLDALDYDDFPRWLAQGLALLRQAHLWVRGADQGVNA